MTNRFTSAERRARLIRRHHLDRSAQDPADATQALVALHATDPASPYLGLRARIPRFRIEDLDAALLEERRLWRLHAMRRTLFLVPTAHAGDFLLGAAQDVARRERKRVESWLAREVEEGQISGSPGGWLARVEAATLEALSGGREYRTQELSTLVPELATQVTLGSGKWSTRSSISSRVLFLLAMEGRIVRTRSTGSWRSSQYLWTLTDGWFGEGPRAPTEAAGTGRRAEEEERCARAELARRYLRAFGPATLDDLRWWAGWPKGRTAAALADVGAVIVALEGSMDEGYLLPDDLERDLDGGSEGAVSFLPALDPTPMGWKERDWYFGPHGAFGGPLFDSNGNAGPTIWLDGSVVGGWGQRQGGEVAFSLLEEIGTEAAKRIETEAAALTAWLDGEVVMPRFPTPLQRALAARIPLGQPPPSFLP